MWEPITMEKAVKAFIYLPLLTIAPLIPVLMCSTKQLNTHLFNYASKIINASTEIAFQYGADRSREVMTVKKNNALVQTKNYYGGLYEEVIAANNTTSYNYYIKAGSQVVAIVYQPEYKYCTEQQDFLLAYRPLRLCICLH